METKEIFGVGRYLKSCQGCKKEFRTEARNARFGPDELCNCLERRAKNRTKRARERRKYHRNPDYYQQRSRIRATARKAMEWHLRTNGLAPACAYPGCKHQGWDVWKGTLQVHHTHGGDLPPNPPQLPDGTWQNVTCFLAVTCRGHHDLFDQTIEKGHELVVYDPAPPDPLLELQKIRVANPKRFWMTPHFDLLTEVLS